MSLVRKLIFTSLIALILVNIIVMIVAGIPSSALPGFVGIAIILGIFLTWAVKSKGGV